MKHVKKNEKYDSLFDISKIEQFAGAYRIKSCQTSSNYDLYPPLPTAVTPKHLVASITPTGEASGEISKVSYAVRKP